MKCLLCGSEEARVLFEKSGRNVVRCSGCSLEWVDPMPSAAELDAYYEASYTEGNYAFFAEAREVRRLIAEYRLRTLKEKWNLPSTGNWLDVGASYGDFVEAARREGIEAEGLELSRSAVDDARSRGLPLHCSAVESHSPLRPLATVTAFDVLEHLREPRDFLQQVRRWLEPQGNLVMTVPDASSFYARWLMRRHWFYYWPAEHLYYWDPTTIRRLLEEEGFEVESVGPAYKMMTIRYAAANLGNFSSFLGGLAKLLVGWWPEALQSRPLPMYVGELIVRARRRD